MSLTTFLKRPEVTAILKPLRPKFPRNLKAELKAPPGSDRHALVGTAFDYLLRFELQRRLSDAVVRRWAAEDAELLVGLVPDQLPPGDLREAPDFDPGDIEDRVQTVLKDAREGVDEYVRASDPSTSQRIRAVTEALFLAKLDAVARRNFLDPRFDDSRDLLRDEDVDDLLRLLEIAPCDHLIRPGRLFLNPDFGNASTALGGADADIIADDRLIEIKVVTKSEVTVEILDQLLGYFLLARRHRAETSTFPSIEHVGIYFARHAHLWTMAVSQWTGRPDFAKTEDSFWSLARTTTV